MDAVEIRRTQVSDYKRTLIRDAARAVFSRAGIGGASLRAIASQAGYTTGAIYVHYGTKEELYADVLRESLASLLEALAAAQSGAGDGERSRAVLRAFLDFYRVRPQDFDLSFYLGGGGAQPVGLNAELNRELNAQMTEVVELVGAAVAADGFGGGATPRHLGTAACSHVFGLLLMLKTGRLHVLQEDLDAHLDTLMRGLACA